MVDVKIRIGDYSGYGGVDLDDWISQVNSRLSFVET